jgi:hypothetical protein
MLSGPPLGGFWRNPEAASGLLGRHLVSICDQGCRLLADSALDERGRGRMAVSNHRFSLSISTASIGALTQRSCQAPRAAERVRLGWSACSGRTRPRLPTPVIRTTLSVSERPVTRTSARLRSARAGGQSWSIGPDNPALTWREASSARISRAPASAPAYASGAKKFTSKSSRSDAWSSTTDAPLAAPASLTTRVTSVAKATASAMDAASVSSRVTGTMRGSPTCEVRGWWRRPSGRRG